MTSTERDHARHLDVVVVGAGLSGIGAGYRLSTEHPGKTWAILEARQAIGGTWDLFRYPGVRSDSDMYTLGYQFKPWRDAKSIADGASILDYIHETAREFGIDEHVRFGTKVVGANFSTADSLWTLDLQVTDEQGRTHSETLTCTFLYSCAGYYDYDKGYDPDIPGLDTFAGTVVHPQFWPEDLDWTDKRVVVIGSGATAVTLVPSMAPDAEHVTMLQRTPTWISAVPGRDKQADALRKYLPAQLAHTVIRLKNIAFSTAFYQFCQQRPQQARKLLLGMTMKLLGDEQMVADHFTPTYDPWDQRMCLVLDGDLFEDISAGRAEVVTDHIDRIDADGIVLTSGDRIDADIIVTATGLQLQSFGGIEISMDGKRVDPTERFVYKEHLLEDIPNMAWCIGYTNASWTLRADMTARAVAKLLAYMDSQGYTSAYPHLGSTVMPEKPTFDLDAGYIKRSPHALPKSGTKRPWNVRHNYALDTVEHRFDRIEESMVFGRAAVREPHPA